MHIHNQLHENPPARPPQFANLILLGSIAALVAYLLGAHRAHLLDWLAYAVFLVCPLVHLFMHGKHGRGHHKD